jgi:hypothetical protein
MKAKGKDDDYINGRKKSTLLSKLSLFGAKKNNYDHHGREGGVGPSVPIHLHPKASIGTSANRNYNNVGGIGGGGGNDDSAPRVIS